MSHAAWPSPPGAAAFFTLGVVVFVVAGLYFGRQVLVPLALATLLSFALAPVVRWLRRWNVPNVVAVVTTAGLAFLAIVALGSVVAWQTADLAQRLPAYQQNVEAKIVAIAELPPGGRLFSRATRMVRDLGQKLDEAEKKANEDATPAPQKAEAPQPLPVVVQQPEPTSTELIRTILVPLARPLATAGIVIVFVIFMLLKRDDLRDRLIRLLGPRDMPRTSQALDDAAWRVGQYLLMQLVVNTSYAVPIGMGLWLIGIPNPVFWAALCLLLRFVPYIGPIIAAFFPLALAVAVDPGWSMLLMTGALFIVVELVTNNFLEPWLYGNSAGLSPVAVIAAAVFWTWLWGPIGLLLSTPLTVCIVVLGRHVPQLAFLDVLLGIDPALSLPERLYQRLLAGDPDEATERAEVYLRTHSLVDFYDDVAIPALALAEHDRARGALDMPGRIRVAEGAAILVDNLAEWEDVNGEDEDKPGGKRDIAVLPDPASASERDGGSQHRVVLCAGARGHLDDAAAEILAQLLEREGLSIRELTADDLQTAQLRKHDLSDVSVVALSYMNADSLAHARFLVRRLRRRMPDAMIVVGFWTFLPEEREQREPETATGADAIATTLAEAVETVLRAGVPEAGDDKPAAEPRREMVTSSG